MVIHQKTREQEIEASLIYCIEYAFKGALQFENGKELAEYILQPDFVGEMTLYNTHSGQKEESSVGIRFLLSNIKRNKGTELKGLILDKNGLGIIDGVESIISESKNKTFTRKDVTLFGLSRQESLYICTASSNPSIYTGSIITSTSRGTIKLYPDDIEKILIHQELNSFYHDFMKQDFLKEEH